MMIRINLLPVRQVKKREMGRQFVALSVGLLIIAGAGNWYWVSVREAEQTRLQTQVSDTERRIAELEKVIGEVNNINKRKKEVEEKLGILDKLRKQRAGPVRLLDALATVLPRNVFIKDFTEANSAVRISGEGKSHEDVSEFMKALSSVVWTPKGIARIVERKREATTARVEMLSGDGSMEDFQVSELGYFFTQVELRTSEASGKAVRFEINMAANYAI